MDQLAIDGNIEGTILPGNDLNPGNIVVKGVHQRRNQFQRLRFVAARRTVDDPDLGQMPSTVDVHLYPS
jgi:hypothetical protein